MRSVWRGLNRPLPALVAMLIDLVAVTAGCMVMFFVTYAYPLTGALLWAPMLICLAYRTFRICSGRVRPATQPTDRIRRLEIAGDKLQIFRAYSSISISLQVPAMIVLFFIFLVGSIQLRSTEGILGWGLLVIWFSWILLRRPLPPRSGPPPAAPPPNLSPSGTPVLPVFPDDVLVAKDEKEFPLERTA